MVIPAVDILDHRVVQLVGGVPGSERITMPDPVETARMWVSRGAESLHVVDLDGAFGREGNREAVRAIIRESGVPVEVGGGVRDEAAVRDLVEAGAERVIVGTRAVNDLEWLGAVSEAFPGKVMLALDTKGGEIAVKAWREAAPISLDEMFARIKEMPLAGVLNTNVDVEGRGGGIDWEAAADFIRRSPHPVVASGGVSSESDALALDRAGAAGAVVGVAVYTGLTEPWKWRTPWRAESGGPRQRPPDGPRTPSGKD